MSRKLSKPIGIKTMNLMSTHFCLTLLILSVTKSLSGCGIQMQACPWQLSGQRAVGSQPRRLRHPLQQKGASAGNREAAHLQEGCLQGRSVSQRVSEVLKPFSTCCALGDNCMNSSAVMNLSTKGSLRDFTCRSLSLPLSLSLPRPCLPLLRASTEGFCSFSNTVFRGKPKLPSWSFLFRAFEGRG